MTKKLRERILKMLSLILFISLHNLSYKSEAEQINQIIKTFCMEGVKDEMLSNKTKMKNVAGIEVAEHTCNCFLNKINSGEGIFSAKETCKTQTSLEFNL